MLSAGLGCAGDEKTAVNSQSQANGGPQHAAKDTANAYSTDFGRRNVSHQHWCSVLGLQGAQGPAQRSQRDAFLMHS